MIFIRVRKIIQISDGQVVKDGYTIHCINCRTFYSDIIAPDDINNHCWEHSVIEHNGETVQMEM